MADLDNMYNRHPRCPYCGYEWIDAWELELDRDEQESEIECGDCEKMFKVMIHLDVKYSTFKIEGEEESDE